MHRGIQMGIFTVLLGILWNVTFPEISVAFRLLIFLMFTSTAFVIVIKVGE